MSIATSRKVVYINSKKKTDGSHSDFSYEFKKTDLEEADHVCVLSAYVPKSFYMVQSGLNDFTLTEDGVDATVYLDVGNYTRTSLMRSLTALLTEASPNSFTYSVTVPTINQADTGKFIYTVAGNGSIQPAISFPSVHNLNELMGFDDLSTNTFTDGVLQSSNVVFVQKEEHLILNSDICREHVLLELYSPNDATYSTIVWECHDTEAHSKRLTTNTSTTFRFWLTSNTDGSLIDLNGLPISITLLLYKRNTIDEKFSKYIDFLMTKK